jgi:hypothetical protein
MASKASSRLRRAIITIFKAGIYTVIAGLTR